MNIPAALTPDDGNPPVLEMAPDIGTTVPIYCCYCGTPAENILDLDARQSQQRYGLKRTAHIEYGEVFRVPYCSEHYQLALTIRKKLEKLARLNSDASWIPMLLGIAIGIIGVFKWTNAETKTTVLGALLFALVIGGFLGTLLSGLLLFLFEPISARLAGALFPLILEPEVRWDLAQHMKAQHEIYPFRILWITYSLGFSLKYDVRNESYTWKKWSIHASICATNAMYASSTSRVRWIRDVKG